METVFKVIEDGLALWAYSPGGGGVYWYDSLKELKEDLLLDDVLIMKFHSDDEFEDFCNTDEFWNL